MNILINFLLYHTPVFYLIQSFWRDEAFSYFMAKPNILAVIENTASDFNPPLYYLILHFWLNIFGKSDEIIRYLSFIPHLITVYIAYLFALKLFSRKFALFVTAFTFLNPMLIYYAFEARMYSFYALFTICSAYFLYSKNWKWYTITTILGLYTHSFFPLILLSFLVFYFLDRKLDRRNLLLLSKPFLFFVPWLIILADQFLRSKNSWIFPVDLNLIKSVLGNLFTGYEGTPGNIWAFTAILSIVIFLFMLKSFLGNRRKALFFLLPVFVPLLLILGYSIVKRPIYVNRYMIFISVFEIFAVSLGIWSFKNRSIRYFAVFAWMLFILIFDVYIAPFKKKTDFKSTFMEINKLASDSDFAYAKTPIGFLETAYYFKNPGKAYVYNPDGISIPNYIGVTVVFPDISRSYFPQSPAKTYLINDDATYELIVNK